jgi:hypothetical protein
MLLIFSNLFLVAVFCYKEGIVFKYVSLFLIGLFVALFVSLLWIMQPSDWATYLAFMRVHTTHSPIDVLVRFFHSALDMLKAGGRVIVSSLAVIFLSSNRAKVLVKGKVSHTAYVALILCVFAICAFYLVKLLLPKELWNSFSIHWWFFWVYSSTALLVVTIVCAVGALIVSYFGVGGKKSKLYLIFLLLAVNPIAMSIGTVNGFGQVQVYLVSWMILIGVAFLIFMRYASIEIRVYSSVLIILSVVISTAYFTRQISPGNFSGQGAISEHNYRLNEEGPLRGLLVDQPTRDLFAAMNAKLSKYPNAPTLVFFDAPGLQYAFGRRWVVADPWLTNYDQPRTKDDVYNCHAITKDPEKVKKTIFIVAREKDISAELRACLAKVGYPDQLNLLGSINTSVGSMTEPIKIYFHP